MRCLGGAHYIYLRPSLRTNVQTQATHGHFILLLHIGKVVITFARIIASLPRFVFPKRLPCEGFDWANLYALDSITGERKVCYTEKIRSPSLSQTLYPVITSHYSPLCHPDHTSLNMTNSKLVRTRHLTLELMDGGMTPTFTRIFKFIYSFYPLNRATIPPFYEAIRSTELLGCVLFQSFLLLIYSGKCNK